MFADLQLSETLQIVIVVGLAVVMVWLTVVSAVTFQLAKEISNFLANERERRGHRPPEGPRQIERWDERH